jgi:NTP pyrophosphatase (non-canonical NTP hydrolase)
MNMLEYQIWAFGKRKNYSETKLTEEQINLNVGAMGLAGEAGEFLDLVKKIVFHGHQMDNMKLAHELGDVLWYLSDIASTLEITLEDLMMINKAKLDARYKDGFSREASIKRVDGL